MKDNRNELCDLLEEADILRNLPEKLPEMEDEAAAKRITERVKREIEIDTVLEKKSRRKRLMVAVVCCLAVIGAFGHKPILAAFQRLFYDLPGVGVYIDEENKKIYEVEIDPPVMEQDGVRVELRDFYCEDGLVQGKIRFTGENLGALPDGSWISGEEENKNALLADKFVVTWYAGKEEIPLYSKSGLIEWEDTGEIVLYERKVKRVLSRTEKIDTYKIGITGFDQSITLKIVEPKIVATPEELGYSVTKNDTTVVARASLTGETIDLEYFVIPSDEVKQAQEKSQRFALTMVAYEFDYENFVTIETAAGERMKGKYERMGNGGKYRLQGTMEDFPLKFHYSPFTGTDGEEQTMEVPLPAKGERQTEALPTAEFHYGTVKLLSIEQEDVIWEDSNTNTDREEEATKISLRYQVVPHEGTRRMYAVQLGLEEGEPCFESSWGGEDARLPYIVQKIFYLPRAERDSLRLTLENPSYWIEGAYDILIEKPTPKA